MSTTTQGSGTPAATSGPVLTYTAMLASLHIKCWMPRCVDRIVTNVALSNNNATQDAGVFTKFLIARTHMSDITEAINEARQFHQTHTLPWEDRGPRLLPAKNYKTYTNGMRTCKQKFEQAVQVFINSYNLYVQQAKHDLGRMFDANEYPPVGHLKDKFDMMTKMDPVQNSSDFRVQIADEEKKKIQAEIEKRVEKNQQEAMADIWKRLYDVVETMSQKLADVDGRVYDAYFTNVEELVNLLPALNITNDQNLTAMCKEIQTTLLSHTPGQLRKDKRLKSEVAKAAGDVLSKFPGFNTDASDIETEEEANAQEETQAA